MAHTCDTSAWEIEEEGFEFKTNPGYIVRKQNVFLVKYSESASKWDNFGSLLCVCIYILSIYNN